MAGETREEIHIENRRLMEQLDRDLKRYDIIYLQAPSGWGKYTFLQDYRAHVKKMLKDRFGIDITEV